MKRKLRHPAHWIAGVMTPLSTFINPVMPFVLVIAFIAYEVAQGLRTKDNAYLDIFEWAVACYVTTGLLLAWILWKLFIG